MVTWTPPSREEGWEGNLVGGEGGHRGALRLRGGLGAVGPAGPGRARGCVCKGPGVRAGWASSASAFASSLRHPEFDWLRFRSGFFVNMLISLSSVRGAVNTTPALRPAEGAVSACGTVWFYS